MTASGVIEHDGNKYTAEVNYSLPTTLGCHATIVSNISFRFTKRITKSETNGFNTGICKFSDTYKCIYEDETAYLATWKILVDSLKELGYGYYIFSAPINDLSRSNLFDTAGFGEYLEITENGITTCSHIIENTSSGHKGDSIDRVWVWSPKNQNVVPDSHHISGRYQTKEKFISRYIEPQPESAPYRSRTKPLEKSMFAQKIEQEDRRLRTLKDALSKAAKELFVTKVV